MSETYIDAPSPASHEQCHRHIEEAKEFPYDGIWENDELQPLRNADNPAHQIARGILYSFNDRRGIKWALDEVSLDVREEIIDTVAMFVGTARNQIIQELIEKAEDEAKPYRAAGRKEMFPAFAADWLKSQMEGGE